VEYVIDDGFGTTIHLGLKCPKS